MQTRDELLRSLEDAVSVIKRLSNIQQRLNKVRAQYKALKPSKKMKRFLIFILVMACMGCIVQLSNGILVFLVQAIQIVLGYFVVKYIYKKKNEKITAHNETIQAQEQAVLNDLQMVQIMYRERIEHWYPEKYCSVDAAEFFCSSVKNYRADNLKEAINLYETTLHQRRIENTQKQALQEQRFANVASLVMQGAALGEMSRHNAVTEFQMKETNRQLFDIQTRL